MSARVPPSRRSASRVAGAVLALAAAPVLPACSGDEPTTIAALRRCVTDVTLGVSTGLTPRFTWTPTCGVGALLVEDSEGGDLWYLAATRTAGIASGITYGVVPEGAAQDAPAVPLVAGETYYVYVAKGPDEALELAGLRSFAP